jgi:hypothetical protein
MLTSLNLLMILIFLTIFAILLIFNRKIKYDSQLNTIKEYKTLLGIFEYILKKSWDMIYKENIFIYSLEATKIKKEDIEKVSKDFGKLTLKLMGSNIKESLIQLYGDEETLLINIMEFFNSNMENDILYKATTQNMMESELKI